MSKKHFFNGLSKNSSFGMNAFTDAGNGAPVVAAGVSRYQNIAALWTSLDDSATYASGRQAVLDGRTGVYMLLAAYLIGGGNFAGIAYGGVAPVAILTNHSSQVPIYVFDLSTVPPADTSFSGTTATPNQAYYNACVLTGVTSYTSILGGFGGSSTTTFTPVPTGSWLVGSGIGMDVTSPISDDPATVSLSRSTVNLGDGLATFANQQPAIDPVNWSWTMAAGPKYGRIGVILSP